MSEEMWKKEMKETPIEERLSRMLELVTAILKDATDQQIEDIATAVPSQAQSIRNLFLTDPWLKKMSFAVMEWTNTYLKKSGTLKLKVKNRPHKLQHGHRTTMGFGLRAIDP